MVRRILLIFIIWFFFFAEYLLGGTIVSVSGDVFINRGNKSFRVKGGEAISDGDVIDASLGRAVVLIDSNQVAVVNNGMLKIQVLEGKTTGYLFKGNARWVVYGGERSFYTPTAVITSSAGNILVKYIEGTSSTEVYQLDGKSTVKNVKESVKGEVELEPLKITVVSENKPPARMLLHLSVDDKKDVMKNYSIVDSFRNRYQERKDLIKLGTKLYHQEEKRSSVFVYPDKNPFSDNYSRAYIKEFFLIKGKGSVKVKWKLKEK